MSVKVQRVIVLIKEAYDRVEEKRGEKKIKVIIFFICIIEA